MTHTIRHAEIHLRALQERRTRTACKRQTQGRPATVSAVPIYAFSMKADCEMRSASREQEDQQHYSHTRSIQHNASLAWHKVVPSPKGAACSTLPPAAVITRCASARRRKARMASPSLEQSDAARCCAATCGPLQQVKRSMQRGEWTTEEWTAERREKVPGKHRSHTLARFSSSSSPDTKLPIT